MTWHQWIDRVVNRLKWPAAILSALASPLLLWAGLRLVWTVAWQPLPLIPFVLGTATFFVLWRRWLGKSRIGKLLITLEHESTHALFAAATWHRIVGFRASVGRGGEVRFTGSGNWLITAAPYFFPTAAILLFLIAYLLPFPGLPWQRFLLGVALGYHIVSTFRETHRDQTDIKSLGRLFCWLFLPAANLAVVGLLVSFAHNGSDGLSSWLQSVTQPLTWLFEWTASQTNLRGAD
jgi:hypothetical protein